MKKILLMVLVVLCLTGCKKDDKRDYKAEVIEYNTNLTKYVLTADMEISKDEGEICFNIEATYLSPNYYKVVLKNKANNNLQVMVKNDEGVYVITPSLNKEFKFNSDWPLNSSHAYLMQSIVKDITNDNDTVVSYDDTLYTIQSKVNNKSNANLKLQKTTFDKKTHHPISNVVYDAANNPLVKVKFTKFDTEANVSKNDFDVEVVNNTCRLEMGEGDLNNNIEGCVPSFMPVGYELTTSVSQEEYKVYSYNSTDATYIISCVVTEEAEVLTVTRTFDDVVLLDLGLGFVNANALSFYNGNIMVTIYNENFDLNETMTIANSFQNK